MAEDTFSREAVVCPWCRVTYGDCWEWVTDTPEKMTCEGCGGSFTYWAEHDVTYNAEPGTPPPATPSEAAPDAS